MNKKLIRLTESYLHRIVKESVNRVLREWDEYNEFDRNGDASDVSPSYERYEHMRIKLLRESTIHSLVNVLTANAHQTHRDNSPQSFF